MASTTANTWLPQLQALLAKAPADANPFEWYAQQFMEALVPPQARWAKPIFLIIAVISLCNVPAAFVALYLKWKQEGQLSLYRMREHRSGGRYVCLNAAVMFLIGHIVTSVVFGTYSLLHIYEFHAIGKAYMDLSWASLMWLAPYTSLLMTSIGVIYGVLVAPSPIGYARRSEANHLEPAHSPLAGLPCWLLNAFIFVAPGLLIISVVVPAVRLIVASKDIEFLAIDIVKTISDWAELSKQNIVPSVQEQAVLLQKLGKAKSIGEIARARWRPVFGTWSGWVALAIILGLVAFFVLHRVTKARLHFAEQQVANDAQEAKARDAEKGASPDRRPSSSGGRNRAMVKQARWEHRSLSFQFGTAAILLIVSEVMLLWDTIYGYDIHLETNLLATALIIPPIAYLIQGTASLVLTIVRTVKGKPHASWSADVQPLSQSASASSPRSAVRSTHTRQESEISTLGTKKNYFSTSARSTSSGKVSVSTMAQLPYAVSPSVVHQIQISQTTQIDTDSSSISESSSAKTALSSLQESSSRSESPSDSESERGRAI